MAWRVIIVAWRVLLFALLAAAHNHLIDDAAWRAGEKEEKAAEKEGEGKGVDEKWKMENEIVGIVTMTIIDQRQKGEKRRNVIVSVKNLHHHSIPTARDMTAGGRKSLRRKTS